MSEHDRREHDSFRRDLSRIEKAILRLARAQEKSNERLSQHLIDAEGMAPRVFGNGDVKGSVVGRLADVEVVVAPLPQIARDVEALKTRPSRVVEGWRFWLFVIFGLGAFGGAATSIAVGITTLRAIAAAAAGGAP